MINSVKARTPILALILFVFSVGFTIAATNKVVVIPMGADTNIAPLIERIEALEAKLACVDSASDASSFLLSGCDVQIDAVSEVVLKAGKSRALLTTTSITIDSATVTTKASGTLNLKGVIIDGGSKPVARQGDIVIVNPTTGVGTITNGNSTVLF